MYSVNTASSAIEAYCNVMSVIKHCHAGDWNCQRLPNSQSRTIGIVNVEVAYLFEPKFGNQNQL